MFLEKAEGIPSPEYQSMHPWEAYFKDLMVDYNQCIEEGKDVAKYEALFRDVAALPDGREKHDLADVLYRITAEAPQCEGYAYEEPSMLAEIKECAEGADYAPAPLDAAYEDRLRGAWYGRLCGCLLGKPVEGISTKELQEFLRRTDNFPMKRYIVKSDCTPDAVKDIWFPIAQRAYDDGIIDGMPTDDDVNYIALGYFILSRGGKNFTPDTVANIWVQMQSKNAYCTAERAAYRNFVNGFRPPESAKFQNPYREWIGAQIRGDFFGWVTPGEPEKAAEFAWRDACISHIKNGIYGEMWVSAMLAAAGAGKGIEESIKVGLSCIPQKSRLHEAITKVIERFRSGMSADEFFADFHTRWNDRNNHHWCHTISNAEIVAAALLWGGMDYGKTVCLAVQQGFDTDCNGATAGSVLGMILGAERIPAEWKDKIGGKLHTDMYGYETLSVEEMVAKSMEVAKAIRA